MLNLKSKISALNNTGTGISFMEGRTKGEQKLNTSITISDYGYINGDDGEYLVYECLEYPKYFFFGGSIVTEKFKEIDALLTNEEKAQLKIDGLPVIFTSHKSKKSKREYTTCEFYPETPNGTF